MNMMARNSNGGNTTDWDVALLSGQPWRRLRSSLGLSELLCILPPDFFGHVTQTS
ncbi:uncharacterized protein FMAN_05787 [Fusarium mangiferae]|uniref:Uncharacterized protein n=1 Tax=Fusarium mangiferae TaxID=192010 RepID=A0A1L7SUZ4_FUSMA|nr:uncharacterized protein FMAN_05787 [Fusarium mangiferae]CVK87026.1 uncharacterized protein FMAN_05787 [Fusarium mangiferae]